jgi:hypothetical protein
MLATRISFMNEMARVAEHAGADIEMVRRGIGADRRIGPDFLQAGAGYGGSCLAKDVRALKHMAERDGHVLRILTAVEATNHEQKRPAVRADDAPLRRPHRGKTIAVWGLAFKPDTDDMRDAPSLVLLERLRAAGARVQVYDPAAMSNGARPRRRARGRALVRRGRRGAAGRRRAGAGDRMAGIPPARFRPHRAGAAHAPRSSTAATSTRLPRSKPRASRTTASAAAAHCCADFYAGSSPGRKALPGVSGACR